MIRKIVDILRQTRASILIEAAFTMPLMIIMLVASHEIGQYIRIQERVQRTTDNITALMASIPSFWPDIAGVDDPNYQDFAHNAEGIMLAANATMYPFDGVVTVAFCQPSVGFGVWLSDLSSSSVAINYPTVLGTIEVPASKLSAVVSHGHSASQNPTSVVAPANCNSFVSAGADNTPFVVVKAWSEYIGTLNPASLIGGISIVTPGREDADDIVLVMSERQSALVVDSIYPVTCNASNPTIPGGCR